MSSSLHAFVHHPRNLFPEMLGFIHKKQPHIHLELEALTRKFPLLHGDRIIYQALCHLLDDKLQEILDGYRTKEALALCQSPQTRAAFERGTMYFRNTATLCYEPGSINAHYSALEQRALQPNLPDGTHMAYVAALCFYKRILAFCFSTMQDAKQLGRQGSRQALVPGPPSEAEEKLITPPQPEKRSRHLHLVGS